MDCNAPSRESGFQFIIKSNFVIALVLLHDDMQLAKDTAKRAAKNEKRFITLLQNELKSNVERLATHETCLATNHVVAGCETLLQKVESSSTCLTKMIEYSPRLFCSFLF